MTKREAKAYVLKVLAAEARHHPGNGSAWLEFPVRADGLAVESDGKFSVADQERLHAAVYEVADELERRAERLARKP